MTNLISSMQYLGSRKKITNLPLLLCLAFNFTTFYHKIQKRCNGNDLRLYRLAILAPIALHQASEIAVAT
jgi:hypothetical protein